MVRAGTAFFSHWWQCTRTLLSFLEQAGHDLLAALPDAQIKDGGWEPAVVAMLLDGLRVTELPAWTIRHLEPAELQAFLHRLRMALAEKALPSA